MDVVLVWSRGSFPCSIYSTMGFIQLRLWWYQPNPTTVLYWEEIEVMLAIPSLTTYSNSLENKE